MAFLGIIRLVTLILVLIFSVIVLGLASHLISVTLEDFDAYFIFSALSIATASITILSLPALIIIDFIRRGAFTSMVVVELSWLGVLWVLWLATAADTASANPFSGTCDFINDELNTVCHEFSAIEGFAFLSFIILFLYSATLLVFAIIGSSRGHKTWTSSVKEANFLGSGAAATTHHETPMTQPVQTQYTGSTVPPPSQGYQGAPSNVPHQPQGSYPQV